jgi:membrane protease YdiL (CAAX protease family)
MNDRKRIVLEALLVFAAFFLPGFLAQSRLQAGDQDIVLTMLTSLVMSVPQILLILYLLSLQPGLRFPDFGILKLTVRDPLSGFIAYLGILAVMIGIIVCLAPIMLFLPERARDTVLQGYRWGLDNPLQLPFALVFCVVSAYREELFFRAYLLTRFEQIGVPAAPAVAATAMLFASGHLYEGWIALLVTGIQGVYLAYVFRKRRNLHTVSIAHGLYNFTVFCLSLILAPVLPK